MVLEIIEEQGTFDGVIGFSQGAALASSLILRRAKPSPLEDLFNTAIFMCASLPFDLDRQLFTVSGDGEISGLDVSNTKASATTTSVVDEMQRACGYSGMPDDGLRLLKRYDPTRTQQTPTMRIPTVHVIGKQDEYHEQGVKLSELAGRDARVLYHNGGHEIPKDRSFALKMARSIQEACDKVRRRC